MKTGIEFWSEHVAAAKLSGQSGASYAKLQGISAKGLYYWQRKLKPAAPEPIGAGKSAHTSKFIALSVASLAGSGTNTDAQHLCQCSLLLPSGLRLDMSALPDPMWLAAMSRMSSGVR